MISLVIPTYNEAEAIQEALRRAAAALRSAGEEFELIVVDDSSADGTAELAESLARELPVRVLRRAGRSGLATAVLEGWKVARGNLLGVMDADLQHPPEVLRDLVRSLNSSGVDLAIASRYTAGGGTVDWSWVRRLISRGATHLAVSVLPWTLADVTDPMSGMFVVRASALNGVQLDPIGYKILLEVLAKCQYRDRVEVPYVFGQRGRGTSKLGLRQYLEYLLHLARLTHSTGQLGRFVAYGLVALAGATVNVGAAYLLTERADWRLVFAFPVAIQLALLNNFFWNHTMTFRARRVAEQSSTTVLRRFLRYVKVCAPGAVLNALVAIALVFQGVQLLPAAVAGVLAGGLWNFLLNIPAIWQIWDGRARSSRLPAA